MKRLSLLLLVFSVGCAGCRPAATDRFDGLFDGSAIVLDLTHAYSASNPNWSGAVESPFRYDTLSAQPSGRPSMGAYSVPEHFGTHLDAPIHSGDGLASVDELTPEQLFGPAIVIDVSGAAKGDADYSVSRADIESWEADHGRIADGAIVLMYSGWSSRWDDPPAYRNPDDEGRMHFPGFGADAARFLMDERSIRGIGTDTPSVDPAQAGGFPVHGIGNGGGIWHLENLALPAGLPATGTSLIVAPIKLEGGSGGQVRVFAILP